MALIQGTKALETWCRLVTEGYANVNIVNMTTSWRNGLAFCAIIHKFRPELINFDQLDPDDSFGNNELAFTTAEQHLGIPALLDPQDMVECELLDRLSILTYLSQFYQTFHGATGPCKESTPTKLRYVTGSSCSSGSSTPRKSLPAAAAMLPGKRSEPCRMCNKPVFILERLHVSGRLLHRTCFKCARCQHQLSIANYYETESGSYCCDVCPDEEMCQTEIAEANKKLVNIHLDSSDNEEADEVNSLPESQRPPVLSTETQPGADISEPVGPVPSITVTEEPPEDSQLEDSKDSEEAPQTTSPDCPPELDPEATIEEEGLETDKEPAALRESEDDVEPESKVEKDEKSSENSRKSEEADDDAPPQLPECDQPEEILDNQNEEEAEVIYPEDLNPFGDDDPKETETEENEQSKATETRETEQSKAPETRETEQSGGKTESTNPFGSDESETEEEQPIKAVQGPPKPPRLSLNPFGSDFEDDEAEDGGVEAKKPRKKRHAPPPPPNAKAPVRPPPPRPPPPMAAGKSKKDEDNLSRRSQILEENHTLDSISFTPMSPDKSNLDGKWKKKKGPAPPRPIPPKRQVKKLPRKAVNMELIDIEIKQQELERQGVDLEKTIRELCEKGDRERAEAGLDNNDRDSLGPEAEDLIVQLFELVNEKNELFRRQTELMYMKREHRLEEEHADIEHQVSCRGISPIFDMNFTLNIV